MGSALKAATVVCQNQTDRTNTISGARMTRRRRSPRLKSGAVDTTGTAGGGSRQSGGKRSSRTRFCFSLNPEMRRHGEPEANHASMRSTCRGVNRAARSAGETRGHFGDICTEKTPLFPSLNPVHKSAAKG